MKVGLIYLLALKSKEKICLDAAIRFSGTLKSASYHFCLGGSSTVFGVFDCCFFLRLPLPLVIFVLCVMLSIFLILSLSYYSHPSFSCSCSYYVKVFFKVLKAPILFFQM